MKQKFNRVILYARQHRANQGVAETLLRLSEFLKQMHIEAVVDIDTALHFDTKLPVLERNLMGNHQDLIVVVGGDGSLLSAARFGIQVNVPVIGINRGRLGFLTDISPTDLESQLGKVLNGNYSEEQRFLLECKVFNGDTIEFHNDALNDVVLSRGTGTHLVEFDVFVNQQLISHYRSDGMIVSTPTGSTAYALSAGGPIMHPALNAVVLVPMFSHSLSSRSIVVDGDSSIQLSIGANNEHDLILSCDGHESINIKAGQHVLIEKNARKLRLLHPLDYHYYDTLRMKLGWESKHQG